MFAAAQDDPCATFGTGPLEARARLLAWLGAGTRDVAWALCSVPRERWTEPAPAHLEADGSAWPALRHVRHLALHAAEHALPCLRVALGALDARQLPSRLAVEREDAAWDPARESGSAAQWIDRLGAARFEMLHLLEAAPDEAWTRALPADLAGRRDPAAPPVGLAWLVMHGYQHEVEHLAAMWRLALYWDRVPAPADSDSGLPLQPADRMESH